MGHVQDRFAVGFLAATTILSLIPTGFCSRKVSHVMSSTVFFCQGIRSCFSFHTAVSRLKMKRKQVLEGVGGTSGLTDRVLSCLAVLSPAFCFFFSFRLSYYLQPKSGLFKVHVLMLPRLEKVRMLPLWLWNLQCFNWCFKRLQGVTVQCRQQPSFCGFRPGTVPSGPTLLITHRLALRVLVDKANGQHLHKTPFSPQLWRAVRFQLWPL